jgi:hypothetical protein
MQVLGDSAEATLTGGRSVALQSNKQRNHEGDWWWYHLQGWWLSGRFCDETLADMIVALDRHQVLLLRRAPRPALFHFWWRQPARQAGSHSILPQLACRAGWRHGDWNSVQLCARGGVAEGRYAGLQLDSHLS